MNRTNSRRDNNQKQLADLQRVSSSLMKMEKTLSQLKQLDISKKSKKKKAKPQRMARGNQSYHPIIDAFAHPHEATPGQFIPSMPPLSTQKFTCHQAFEVTIGTLGVGFIGFRPMFASDRDSLVYSTSTFAGANTAAGITNAAVAGVAGIPISSYPYSFSTMMLPNGATGNDSLYRPRLVSFGANISYSGKAIDRAGTIYSLVSTTGENVANRTLSQIIANPSSVRYNVNDMEHAYVTIHGTLREHYNLQNPEITGLCCLPDSSNLPNLLYYDYTAALASNAPPCVAIMFIQGTAGSTFNCDVIVHYEVGGEGPGCLLTPCFADEISLSQANNVSKISQSIAKAHPDAPKSSIAQAALSYGMNAGASQLSKQGASLESKGGYAAVAGMGMQLGAQVMRNKGIQKSVGKGISKLFKR